MPSRDPNTGKELSGAQKRERREKKAQAAVEASRKDDKGEWSKAFRKAGKPNLSDPGTDLDYTRKLQLIVLEQMATTPFPTPAQIETWKRIREMSAVVGMTSNRAQLEAKVRKLQAALAQRRDNAGAMRLEPASKVKKPATARGMTKPGPRALPPDATVEPPPLSFEDPPEEPPKDGET